MAKKTKWRKWLWRTALVLGVAFLGLLVFLVGFRESWAEPVPGVSTAMTRPIVTEEELGPASAYRLLLEAVEPPKDADAPPGDDQPATETDPVTGLDTPVLPAPVWREAWWESMMKFRRHPWPSSPPPSMKESADDGGDEGGGALEDPDHMPPWTLEQCRDIERRFGLHAPKLAALDRALEAPHPQMPTVAHVDDTFPYLASVRDLGRWLCVSAQYRAAHGDLPGAFEDVRRGLQLGSLVTQGGTVIHYLVGRCCQAAACEAAWQIAIRHQPPPALLRRAAQDFLDAEKANESLADVMRAEALFAKSAVAIVYSETTLDPIARPAPKPVQYMVFALAWPAGSTPKATTRNLDACYQRLVSMASTPYSRTLQETYDWFGRELATLASYKPRLICRMKDPLGLHLAARVIPCLLGAHCAAATQDALLRGMAAFCAVAAHRQERGTLAESLEELVPEYLPCVPADPFDGEPLRYIRHDTPGLSPDTWAVYSVGRDFVDDGGRAYWTGFRSEDQPPGVDLVWPSRPYSPLPEPELDPLPAP